IFGQAVQKGFFKSWRKCWVELARWRRFCCNMLYDGAINRVSTKWKLAGKAAISKDGQAVDVTGSHRLPPRLLRCQVFRRTDDHALMRHVIGVGGETGQAKIS